MTNKKFSLADFKGGRQLSREEMKKIGGGAGGCAQDGMPCSANQDCCSNTCTNGRCLPHCSETCTNGNHTASCSSDLGYCDIKKNALGITTSIICDGISYDC